jgi:ABC-type uncharacterized transport system permease subunit
MSKLLSSLSNIKQVDMRNIINTLYFENKIFIIFSCNERILWYQSVSLGYQTVGYQSISVGYQSVSVGYQSVSVSYQSVSIGYQSVSVGYQSVSVGYQTVGYQSISVRVKVHLITVVICIKLYQLVIKSWYQELGYQELIKFEVQVQV